MSNSRRGGPPVDAVFAGPGELRARCRDFDWASTPLGPMESWCGSLRTAAQMVLASGLPATLLWGRSYIQLYNDAYAAMIQQKHPAALGRETLVTWPEVADFNRGLFERVFAGETITLADALYPLERSGEPEEVYLTVSHSPVVDESGEVAGILVTVLETTHAVRLRQLQEERESLIRTLEVERGRLASVFAVAPAFLAVLRGPNYVFELVNDAYCELVGRRDLVGRRLWEAVPEAQGQGFEALMAHVLETGQPLHIAEVPVRLRRGPVADLETRYLDLTYLVLAEPDGTRSGIIAHGMDVTEQVLARQQVDRLLLAERAARARIDRLQEATARLSAARTPAEVAEVTLQAGLEALDLRQGSVCAIDDSDPSSLGIVRTVGYPEVALEVWPRIPLTPDTLIGDAVLRRAPVLIGSRATVAERYPALRSFLESTSYCGGAVYPLIAGDPATAPVLGAVAFDFDRERELDADDARFLAGLAQLCAHALERARLYQAEQAAREAVEMQQSLLGAVLDQMPVGVSIAEAPSGRLLYSNPAGNRLLGHGVLPGEGSGSYAQYGGIHLDGSPYQADEYPLARALAGALVEQELMRYRRPDGQVVDLALSAAPVYDGAGRMIRGVCIWTDITERVALEDALRRAKAEAEHANRAKSEFLAAMSHELRTPLNAIGGYVDLLQLAVHGPINEAQAGALERVRLNGKHLLALINDILQFARIEAGRLQLEVRELAAADVLADVQPLVQPQIETRGLTADFRATADLRLRADPHRVRQILLNLVGNAIKFTEPPGTISIWSHADTTHIHFHVADTGHGIPADALERIFDPFVQLDRLRVPSPQQGVGLGLSISRDLARSMGGDITVQSVPGQGSRFTLLLPKA